MNKWNFTALKLDSKFLNSKSIFQDNIDDVCHFA